MSNVRIESGFRVPYERYREFPAQLRKTLPVAHAGYAKTKILELRDTLASLTAESVPGFLGVIEPRGYTASNFVRHRMKSGDVQDMEFAVSALADFAPYFMHPHQRWSSYDLTIRIDLWMVGAEQDGLDSEYVYGRVVASNSDVFPEVLAIEGVEEFSYYDKENASEEWTARAGVWETVSEDSRTQWDFIPDNIWLHEVVEN
jgi:hypothetical protein